MGATLVSIAVQFALGLLGKIFPSLAPKDPAVEAQAQKDRADSAESLLKAKVEGDAIQDKFSAAIAVDPGKLRQSDKFETR
jgi:hypothetical protein